MAFDLVQIRERAEEKEDENSSAKSHRVFSALANGAPSS